MLPKWNKIRDCVAGSEAVKAKGDTYLPRPNPEDTSPANTARYTSYLNRSVFYNVTSRTLNGLVGEVFTRPITVELNGALEPLIEDADGKGVAVDRQAKNMLGKVLSYGRCGVLTDFPSTAGNVTVAQQLNGEVRPTITVYDPWDIINWRNETVGGRNLVSLVVLHERAQVPDGEFGLADVERWRVLRLVEGAYTVEVWEQNENNLTKTAEFVPTDGRGRPFPEIPFVFVGWDNLDAVPDAPPMLDLANLNIAHYRNSADYEDSCYLVGQPTPVFGGLTQDWVENVLKGKVYLGSRASVPLPAGGSAELLQAAPNSMVFEAMQHKERQMVALGARLIEQKEVQRTATEAGMEERTELSVLGSAVMNVNEAYSKSVAWAANFANQPVGGDRIELPTELDVVHLTAQDQVALISLYQSGIIAKPEVRERLRRVGIATLEDEEAEELIASDIGGLVTSATENGGAE